VIIRDDCELIKLKRVYDKVDKNDGFRILVDRLWPRGLSKEKARIDLWLKNVAPSNELRKWFAHQPKKWNGFKRRYFKELYDNKSELKELIRKKAEGVVTLLYAAKNEKYNNAVALTEYLKKRTQ
jgi:uncharacterized protein YeaO (DUF488 family)